MTQYGVILFPTVSATMKAHKLLSKAGFEVELIPPPRELSMDCGVSLRFDWDKSDAIKSALAAAVLEIASVHPMP